MFINDDINIKSPFITLSGIFPDRLSMKIPIKLWIQSNMAHLLKIRLSDRRLGQWL